MADRRTKERDSSVFRRIRSLRQAGRGLYRVLRANPLTFVGFILVAFIVLTALLVVVLPPVTAPIFGQPKSILPSDPNDLVDEKNTPPLTVATVQRNSSFSSWSQNSTNPGPAWANASRAMSIDGSDATSNATGQQEVFFRFNLFVLRDPVTAVGVNLWFNLTSTTAGHYVGVQVSPDSGATWTLVRPAVPAGGLIHLDFTGVRSWTAADLSTTAFEVRITHLADVSGAGNVSLDFVGATTTWLTGSHLFGTDNIGRDMFSRVLAALPLDLVIGFSVAGFALLVGTGLGLVAGFWDRPGTFGGAFSLLIMRVTDMFLAFPSLVLALAIAASLGRGTGSAILAIMITWWPFYVRLVRGEVLAVKHLPYVTAARAAGVSGVRILFRHVFRNILEPLVVYYTMDVGTVIVTFSTISFIGIGVPPTVAEWGGMVETYQKLLLTAPWTVLAPGLAIFVTVLAFSLLGDGLRDILDPRSRRALVQPATAPGLPPPVSAASEA